MAVRDRELHDLKVVLNLVERRLSDKYFGPAANPSSSVAVVSTWRSSTSSSSQVLLNAQSMVHVFMVQTTLEALASNNAKPAPSICRNLGAVWMRSFNVDERLVRIAARSEQERDLGDVWSVFGQVKRVGAGVVRGEHHGLAGNHRV